MKLTLRSYEPEDFEILYEIDQECYEPAIAYSKREFRNYLRFPGAECVIAEQDGKVAGFCLTAHQQACGYIITIDVLEEFRRHGVGTLLLLLIPFIPGLRDIPRWIPLHRLVWRDWNRRSAGPVDQPGTKPEPAGQK